MADLVLAAVGSEVPTEGAGVRDKIEAEDVGVARKEGDNIALQSAVSDPSVAQLMAHLGTRTSD